MASWEAEVAAAAATEGPKLGSEPGVAPVEKGEGAARELERPPALEVGDQGSFAWSGAEGGVSGHYASLSHIGGSGSDGGGSTRSRHLGCKPRA